MGLGVQPDRAGHGFLGRKLAQVRLWDGRNVCINRGGPAGAGSTRPIRVRLLGRMPSSVPSGGCERVPQERGQGGPSTGSVLPARPGPDAVDHRAGPGHVVHTEPDSPDPPPRRAVGSGRRAGRRGRAVGYLGLVQGFSVPDRYATGLLLVGMASAGPLGIKAAQLARADLPYAIALVVVLGVANAVAIPVWVALLLPPGVQVPMGPVVRTCCCWCWLRWRWAWPSARAGRQRPSAWPVGRRRCRPWGWWW